MSIAACLSTVLTLHTRAQSTMYIIVRKNTCDQVTGQSAPLSGFEGDNKTFTLHSILCASRQLHRQEELLHAFSTR